MDDTVFKCLTCKKIVMYTETEACLDLGKCSTEYPIKASFPRIHISCGGIVEHLDSRHNS